MPADPTGDGVVYGDRGMSAALESGRFHALDRVRAVAMLLGVVYHSLLFRMFTGGGFPGMSGPFEASKLVGDWLHSFRMPLFFLIAGFFGRMMLGKYGTKEFLRRRWWRIGLPLLIGVFTFGPLYVLTLQAVARPPSFGPAGPDAPGRMGPPPDVMTPAPGGPPGAGAAMPDRGPGPGPGAFPPGPPPAGRGFRPPGGGNPFGPPSGGLAERIFGPYTRYVQLNHLWFLWYLLVFATVTPFLTMGLAWFAPAPRNGEGDRLGLRLVRLGLAPALLAIVSTPALFIARGPFGWFLGIAGGIFRAFPDFLYQFDLDMLFYFAYFLAGWWLHREREALPSLAGAWWADLLIGLGAFGAAVSLEARYGGGPFSTTDPGISRPIAVALYGLGSACTCFAFLGVFLRYLDSPSKTWRYLADTALWVYLIHQPLVVLGLAACRPLNLPWWALTALVSTSSVLASLLLYEALVRRTPLARVFGPSASRRPPVPAPMDEQPRPALS